MPAASITDLFSHLIERGKPAPFLPRTHCWLWIGAKDKRGYGRVIFRGKHWLAHRLSYFLKYKMLENHGRTLVCHTCDNPSCVNPKHLFLGTNSENQLDRIKSRSQLSLEDIDFLRNSMLPAAILATQFRLSQREIRLIRPKTFHRRGKLMDRPQWPRQKVGHPEHGPA